MLLPLPLVKAITNGKITTCLDAQRQSTAIAQQAPERPALHVVAAMAATGLIQVHPRSTPRQEPAEVSEATSAVLLAAEGRAGREPVRPWFTHLPKYER